MAPPRKASRLVYSTELGRTCPECRRPLGECRCRQDADRIVGDGNVRVARESKGRNGKAVTVITGLPLRAAELATLSKQLKQRCGAGGTVRDGTIEIQGEHRDGVVTYLISLGYRARKSGG